MKLAGGISLPTISSITKGIGGGSPVDAPGTSPNNRGGAEGINPPQNQQPTLLTSPLNSTAISGPNVGTLQLPGTLSQAGGNSSAAPVGQPVGGAPPDNGPTGPAPLSYSDMLNNDALYQQLLQNLSAASNAANQTALGNTQQALINYGDANMSDLSGNGLTSGMQNMLSAYITPDVTNAAQSLTNTGNSTLGQLATTHTQNLNNLLDSLAAHGTVQSGATTSGTNLEDQRNGTAQYGATSSLIQYLTGVQQAFNTAQQSIAQQQQQGVSDALARELGLNPGISVTGSVPSYVPVQAGQTGSTGGTLTTGLGG